MQGIERQPYYFRPGRDIMPEILEEIRKQTGLTEGELLQVAERQQVELSYDECAVRADRSRKHIANLVSRGRMQRTRPGFISRESADRYFRQCMPAELVTQE